MPQASETEGASSADGRAAGVACVSRRRYSKHTDPALVISNSQEAASHGSFAALLPFIRRPKQCSDSDAKLANKEG